MLNALLSDAVFLWWLFTFMVVIDMYPALVWTTLSFVRYKFHSFFKNCLVTYWRLEIYQRGWPDVVVLTEDHASFAVAGAAVLAQLSLAARALEAARVPVPLHGEEQEAVCDSTSASCTRPARLHPAAAHHCHCGRLHPAVHHSALETWKGCKREKTKSQRGRQNSVNIIKII